ncbi:MAG: group II intron reverse transcriptase/maturase [Calditrichaeota bacterium]|nr:group II intron reverse transcriptase/maturase [Calditrichota bacterium]
MSTVELQIAERARKFKHEALTNLQQFINEELLEDSYRRLNRGSSAGVDGESWQSYEADSSERISELLSQFKNGKYKAPPVRRVYIPKDKSGKRAIGIPTIEDKILQESVRRVLNPIYEEEFKEFSFGFRKGRSAHQALDYLFKQVSFKGLRYIIDADIKSYFDSISHEQLREFLDLRVKDGVIRRTINKWLKAGILDGQQLSYPQEGTPQGGLISPLLSNIYLHYVLDVWFSEQIQPLLRGKSMIVRYADDFVLGFEFKSDADRVLKVLAKRFKKYHLELHKDKTKLIDLQSKRGEGDRSFDFLGFTHYLGCSRKGKPILKRKTSSKRKSRSLRRLKEWLKKNRHKKLSILIAELNVKLRGHYNYYGITFNFRGINSYYYQVIRILHKWLNRRGGKRKWNWERYRRLIYEWYPLLKPKIYHNYLTANPI